MSECYGCVNENNMCPKCKAKADPRPDPLEALREAREALFDRYDDDKVSQALAKINEVMGEAG